MENNNNLEENTELESKQVYFNDEYLIEDTDKKLINVEHVEKKVDELISNYKSDSYNNYNKLLHKIPKVFGKKGFIIEYKNESIKIYKVKKDDKKLIHNIVKPKINELLDFNDELLSIRHTRNQLKTQYLDYIKKENVSLTDKNKFTKDKNNLIEKLENYYIQKNYYMIINNLVGSDNFNNISIGSYLPYLNSKAEYDSKLFFSHYKINPEIIDELNQNKISSLDNIK